MQQKKTLGNPQIFSPEWFLLNGFSKQLSASGPDE
jgi:hypothetical protein